MASIGKYKHETVGEKLLKSYNMLSYISVVPPTPPPDFKDQMSRHGDILKSSKPFTKSMEDLMVSFTSHIKKISKSQNDVRVEQPDRLTVVSCLSDTYINRSANLTRGPSLPNLLKKGKDSDQDGSSTGPEEDTSLGSEYSGGKRGSSSSASTDCGLSEGTSVTGDLELALAYNFNTSCLEVTVGSCRNLTYGDVKRKKCHPYVKIYLLPDKNQSSKRKTAVRRNTTDPVYNELLRYNLECPLLYGCMLQASVWHSGTLKRKVFLGEALIPLEAWRFQDRVSHRSWYPLCPKRPASPEGGTVEQDSGGELLVKIKLGPACESSGQTHGVNFVSHGNDRLTVLIKGVKHLPIKANTSQNTYVKGCLALSSGRELVQTTPRAGSEGSHQLLFDGVSASELWGCVLTLDLWERVPLTPADRPLGRARIDGNKIGLPWHRVLRTSNKWHDFSFPFPAGVNSRRT